MESTTHLFNQHDKYKQSDQIKTNNQSMTLNPNKHIKFSKNKLNLIYDINT